MICECTDRIICANCTQPRVNYVRHIEKETGIDIKNTQYYSAALKFYEDKKKTRLNAELRRLRREKGYSIETIAENLGTSKNYYRSMENARKSLNKKAVFFIEHAGMFPGKR